MSRLIVPSVWDAGNTLFISKASLKSAVMVAKMTRQYFYTESTSCETPVTNLSIALLGESRVKLGRPKIERGGGDT